MVTVKTSKILFLEFLNPDLWVDDPIWRAYLQMGWNHQLEMLVENLYHCLISAMFLFGFYHLNLVEHESMKLHMIDDCLEVGCPLPPGLIAFNKYLMNADRFPYAKAMTAMHMAMTTFMSLLLYTCAPSLYPSMGKAKENWRTSISPREVVFFLGGGANIPRMVPMD